MSLRDDKLFVLTQNYNTMNRRSEKRLSGIRPKSKSLNMTQGHI